MSEQAASGVQLPLQIAISANRNLYGGVGPRVLVHPGITTLVGPNGTGKTHMLRELAGQVQNLLHGPLANRRVRYLSAGRSSPMERFRAAVDAPGNRESSDAAVGHASYSKNWWRIESVTGDLLALEARADLRLKVEATLQQLFSRSLRLTWSQAGLGVAIVPLGDGNSYPANYEASGILQLVALLAAIHNDEIGCLLIDEPEISLHPQHQAFVLQEIEKVAGDPSQDPSKKLVLMATHSPSMLPVKSASDLSRVVFFSGKDRLPVQLSDSAGELRGRKIKALISRLSATHRLAFFADTVLLLEGPSDEIIATQLAQRLDHPMLSQNTQTLAVTGKGEFVEVAKLFRSMGKRAVVLADLDGLSDSNTLVNYFSSLPSADRIAARLGHESAVRLDAQLRGQLAAVVSAHWPNLEPIVGQHTYWRQCPQAERSEETKRRATLATLLGGATALFDDNPVVEELSALRARYEALLVILSELGCYFLRRGAIEDYFAAAGGPGDGKPEAAAEEASTFLGIGTDDLRQRYADVVASIENAASVRAVNENDLLRVKLAAALASIFQTLTAETSGARINSQAATVIGADAGLFWFENISTQEVLRLRVHMNSALFARPTFPFEIDVSENLTSRIRDRLP